MPLPEKPPIWECYDKGWNYDYDVVSRFLLELGWSWLGYTSYLDMQVLNWMKAQSISERTGL